MKCLSYICIVMSSPNVPEFVLQGIFLQCSFPHDDILDI